MKRKNGFTLVELVMVIVIIGLLSAIIVPKFADQRAQASISTTKANLESLRTAVALFTADDPGGNPPASLAILIPQYLRAIPEEAFGQDDTENNGACPAGAAGTGWLYNPATGDVCVNSAGADANGDLIEEY